MNNSNSSQERNVLPKAILVTFLSTFISLFIVFLFIYFKGPIENIIGDDLLKIKATKWLLFFVFILVIRHQLRVVFIDFVYVKSMEIKLEKIVLWLLLLIAIMGSMVFYIFNYGVLIASWFMVVYTFLFLLLSIFMLGGQKNSPTEKKTKKENINAIISTIIDLFCLIIWLIAALKLNNESPELTGFIVTLLAILIFIIVEFNIIFMEPFRERIRELWNLIKF